MDRPTEQGRECNRLVIGQVKRHNPDNMGTLIRAWDWLAGGILSARLALLNWLFATPETPVDRAIREEGERLRKAFPGLFPIILCALLLPPQLAAAEHRSRAVAREFQRWAAVNPGVRLPGWLFSPVRGCACLGKTP